MLKVMLLAVVGLYGLIAVLMFASQRRLLYHPDATRTSPATLGLSGVAERIIETADGNKLIAWYGRARAGQPTLLYFHGNAGALSDRADQFASYMARGFGVYMLAYRGYSGSTGAPTESDNVADARLAYDALIGDGVPARDIVVYGESLGTGVSVQLLASDGGLPARGLVLDSPFTSIVERAGQLYPWLPVSIALRDTYRSDRAIADVHVPLLIVHGEQDNVVPVEMGRQLFALANEPKKLVTIAGAGHNNHADFGSSAVIADWIDQLLVK